MDRSCAGKMSGGVADRSGGGATYKDTGGSGPVAGQDGRAEEKERKASRYVREKKGGGANIQAMGVELSSGAQRCKEQRRGGGMLYHGRSGLCWIDGRDDWWASDDRSDELYDACWRCAGTACDDWSVVECRRASAAREAVA